MKLSKKMIFTMLGIWVVLVVLVAITGCGNRDVVEDENKELVEESEEKEENDVAENSIRIIGQVTEAVGNELTIQVANMDNNQMEGMLGGRTERNENGEMSEGMTEREKPEDMNDGEKSADMMNREKPEGMEDGEKPEGMDGRMPEGMENGMMGAGEEVDYSKIFELTEEYASFTIPVGAEIMMSGVESTMTQIQEEYYVVITENEDGTVVSVEILG